jgi:hypothetical protein
MHTDASPNLGRVSKTVHIIGLGKASESIRHTEEDESGTSIVDVSVN